MLTASPLRYIGTSISQQPGPAVSSCQLINAWIILQCSHQAAILKAATQIQIKATEEWKRLHDMQIYPVIQVDIFCCQAH